METTNPRLTDYTDRLFDLCRQRLAILETMDQLNQSWDPAICRDPDRIMSLLAKRQPQLERLTEIERQLGAYRGDDPDQRVWRTPELRQQCRAIARRADRLLKSLIDQDQRFLEQCHAARELISTQLRDSSQSTQVRNAYSSPTQLESSVLDITEA